MTAEAFLGKLLQNPCQIIRISAHFHVGIIDCLFFLKVMVLLLLFFVWQVIVYCILDLLSIILDTLWYIYLFYLSCILSCLFFSKQILAYPYVVPINVKILDSLHYYFDLECMIFLLFFFVCLLMLHIESRLSGLKNSQYCKARDPKLHPRPNLPHILFWHGHLNEEWFSIFKGFKEKQRRMCDIFHMWPARSKSFTINSYTEKVCWL